MAAGIASGMLPPGMEVVKYGNQGQIRGTPTSAGNYTFRLQVTDDANGTGALDYRMRVDYPRLSITTGARAGMVGQKFSSTFIASGGSGTYAWAPIDSPSSPWPSWLSISASTGVLSGTPPAAGTQNVRVQVTDSAGATINQEFSIGVVNALNISPSGDLLDTEVGLNAGADFRVDGGSGVYTWLVTDAPPGMGLCPMPTAATCTLFGNPTQQGTYHFTMKVTDGLGYSASKSYALTVYPRLYISNLVRNGNNLDLPIGGRIQLRAEGGAGPYTWNEEPGNSFSWYGLTLHSDTGVIDGTPINAYRDEIIVVTVRDGHNGIASERLYLRTRPGFSVSVDPATNAEGTVGKQYRLHFLPSGGTAPWTWSIDPSLPAGVQLNGDTINGIFTATYDTPHTISVTSADGSTGTLPVEIKINGALSFTPASGTLTASPGLPFHAAFNPAGGSKPLNWSLSRGSLPSEFRFSSFGSDLAWLDGTPAQPGTYPISVTVTDSAGASSPWY